MLEVADSYRELSEGDAIGVIDRCALQHRLPNGKTVLDQFLGSWPTVAAWPFGSSYMATVRMVWA